MSLQGVEGVGWAMSIVVLDGVVDNDLRQLILSKFAPLAPAARTALPEVLVPNLAWSGKLFSFQF